MPRLAASLLVAIVGSLWILAAFHDRSWWPPDEGQYAHVAERLLDGEQLHRDVRDPHTDYGHWLNAAALALFGRDLVSLRYLPAAASLLCACGIWQLLRVRDPWLAACAALAATALGFVQFPNPTPNWLAPPLVVLAAIALIGRSRARAAWVGAIVGVLLGLRQPTGVYVAIGAIAALLVSAEPGSDAGAPRLARTVLSAAAAATAVYLAATTDALGWALFGVWPLALLVWCAATVRAPDRLAARLLGRFALASAAGLLPMLLVHAVSGTLPAWWRDVVASALRVPELGYLAQASYGDWLGAALASLGGVSSLRSLAGALYWLVLPLLAAANGAALLIALARGTAGARASVLPILASFHALVALLNQIPIYLYYGAGLSLAGLVWTLRPRSLPARAGLGAGVLALAGVAVAFHAGQPHTRTIAQVVAAERVPLVENRSVARARLWMEPDQERAYRDLIARVHALTGPDDRLLVVPNDAEVYFLAQRRSAVDFWSSALGLGDAESEASWVARLRADPPALIVHVPGDKSATPALSRLLAALSDEYGPPEHVHYFELLRRLQRAGRQRQGDHEP